jgi:hypothetical protein
LRQPAPKGFLAVAQGLTPFGKLLFRARGASVESGAASLEALEIEHGGCGHRHGSQGLLALLQLRQSLGQGVFDLA